MLNLKGDDLMDVKCKQDGTRYNYLKINNIYSYYQNNHDVQEQLLGDATS